MEIEIVVFVINGSMYRTPNLHKVEKLGFTVVNPGLPSLPIDSGSSR